MLTILVAMHLGITRFARTRITACIVVVGRIGSANKDSLLNLERSLLVAFGFAIPIEITP